MSVEAMNAAYQRAVGSPTRKAVLVTLANMADQDGKCYPSIQYIADRTELAYRTVVNALNQLERDGHIKKTARTGKHGKQSNTYVIDLCDRQEMPIRCANDNKKVSSDAYRTVFNNYICSIGAEAEFKDWQAVRKRKKASWSERTQKDRLKELKSLSSDPAELRAIIAQSADRGWLAFYPMRKNDATHKQGGRQTRPERLAEQAESAYREAREASQGDCCSPVGSDG